jgi:hypothetical protein
VQGRPLVRRESRKLEHVMCLPTRLLLSMHAHDASSDKPPFITTHNDVLLSPLNYYTDVTSSNDNGGGGIDIDEFCPSMDEANLRILKQIGDHADDTSLYSKANDNSAATGSGSTIENESDSDNDDLLPRNAVIPEPDEIDFGSGSGGIDDSLDLIENQNLVLTQSAEYKRKHFSNTSSESSDSDDSITRGLDFKNIPVTATIEPHTSPSSSQHNLLTDIQHTLARNLIENITSAAVGHIMEQPKSSQKKIYESEDDSDFEILDSEEIPK